MHGLGEAGTTWRGKAEACKTGQRAQLGQDTLQALTGKRADIAARFVVRLVGLMEGASECELLATTRGPEAVARLRQIAMYLLHTALSAPYGEVARTFGRDRTTVSHACALVEDLRDDPVWDSTIGELESLLSSIAPLFAPAREA